MERNEENGLAALKIPVLASDFMTSYIRISLYRDIVCSF
jgi:hypothetical protein